MKQSHNNVSLQARIHTMEVNPYWDMKSRRLPVHVDVCAVNTPTYTHYARSYENHLYTFVQD